MKPRRRWEPMPVKYWSSAGLMLTQWCNASCASCYLRCHPGRREEMSADEAIRLWRELIDACPHGCRIHLTGGEAFGRWDRLIELCRRASDEGLAPLANVETNAFWASDEAVVRDRLTALAAAGVKKFVISADPYHQQYVPIARARLAARVGEEVFGAGRVQVRWRDWLDGGCDTDAMTDSERAALFARYAAGGRDRMNGRAAEVLAPLLADKTPEDLADEPCRDALLRSRHVHIGPGGWIMPGVCAGILVGRADERQSVGECWRRLADDHADRPVVGALAASGPTALLPMARQAGFTPAEKYADKCHLCWDIRRHLQPCGPRGDELGPGELYEPASVPGAAAPAPRSS